MSVSQRRASTQESMQPATIEAWGRSQWFQGLKFCRLVSVPRQSPNAPMLLGDVTTLRREAALTAAFGGGAGGPVTFGWLRSAADDPLAIWLGSDTLISSVADQADLPSGGTATCQVMLPPGATGRRIPGEDIQAALAQFKYWQALALVQRPPVDERLQKNDGDRTRPELDDALATTWRRPAVYGVFAVPLGRERVAGEIGRVELMTRAPGQRGARHEADQEMARRRYLELLEAQTRGLWQVALVIGAATSEDRSALTSLVAASLDLADTEWLVNVSDVQASSASELLELLRIGRESDTSVSTVTLARLIRPPIREIPGVRATVVPQFDLVVDGPKERGGEVELGMVLDSELLPTGPMYLERKALNNHAFVCGATGSGKSQTIRTLLEQLSRTRSQPVPWLVIEPAKAEYRRMAGRLRLHTDVLAIRPGMTDAPAAGLNPLQPEPGFPLQTHLDLTRALFLASFQAEEPFPQVLSAALTQCYEELGWDLMLGESRIDDVTPRWPTLGDLQRVAKDVVTRIGYGDEITRDVRGFVDVRLSSLRHGTPGRFFEGGHPIDVGRLMCENVVLEIEDLGDDRDKAFLIGTVIIRLVEHLRVRARTAESSPSLQHVMVIEEAHRLLRRPDGPGPAVHAVEMFASLLAEVRAYGEGIVVAEQIPSKLIPDVIKNTSVKVVHRLPALDDRQAVGATMNLTDAQSEYVVTVEPGSAAVFTEGMDYPALVRMPLGEDRESDKGLRFEPPLDGRFSSGCGPLCRERACTLREIRGAQRALEDDPRIVLWVELAVLAHILGFATPGPSVELRAHMVTLDRRTVECAVSHAVDRSGHVRARELSRHYSPAQLTEHVSELLLTQLDGETSPCNPDDRRWQAPPFRWFPLCAMLAKAQQELGFGRLPKTAALEDRYGVELPGETLAEQLEALTARIDNEEGRRPTLLFGSEIPSPLEQAVGAERTDRRWDKALAGQLAKAVVLEQPWPQNYLALDGNNDDQDRQATCQN
jgi:hypothetical protein